MYRRPLSATGVLGIAAGALLVLDSALLDLPGNDNVLANTPAVAVPALSIFLVTGVYLALQAHGRSRLLDLGALLSIVGLTLVAGIDFSVNYVLLRLDEGSREALLGSGPTLPALVGAGLLFVLGAVVFGAAMIRAGFARPASWLYVLTVAPSGFASQLPDAVGAGSQILTGLAVIMIGWELRSRAAAMADGPSTRVSGPAAPTPAV